MRGFAPTSVRPLVASTVLLCGLALPLPADDAPDVGTEDDSSSQVEGVRPDDSPKPAFRAEKTETGLVVRYGERIVASYVHTDESILRPYFANVHATTGELVTRHHPPRDGKELTDHATMHPGIWLAFGDISGADFWRNKARVRHVAYEVEPAVDAGGVLSFRVRNAYVSGEKSICSEVCTHTIRAVEGGWLLTYDSTFTGEQTFAFGDQEEMGLGIRVAAPLRVRAGGGTIENSEGLRNEKDVWGKASAFVTYGGVVDGRRIGVQVVPHPENFRKSWFHARDYGFVAANPFGRKAFAAGEPSRVTVEPGSAFRLRFGVLVYSTPETDDRDAKTAAESYVGAVRETEEPVSTDADEASGN